MYQEEDVEALVALGLTTLQAKVYLTLNKLEEAKTKSETAKVARQEIYRVMNKLQNLCLVEKVIAKPVRYKAVPMQEAVPHLLKRIHEKRLESHNKAMQLIERHRHKKRN